MPRVRRKGHKRNEQYGNLSRPEIIRGLVDDFEYPDVKSLLLSGIPESERARLVEEALNLFYTERHERQLPTLRERLQTLARILVGLNPRGGAGTRDRTNRNAAHRMGSVAQRSQAAQSARKPEQRCAHAAAQTGEI